WDHATGLRITNISDAHPPFAFSVKFSRDGRLLASGGADGTGKIWEVIAGGLRFRQTLHGQLGWMDLAFSPGGQRIVSNSRDNALKFWDTRTGVEVGAIYGHGGGVTGFAFSADANTIYSAAQNGDIFSWRAPLSPTGSGPHQQ